jgi:hypothetical protein
LFDLFGLDKFNAPLLNFTLPEFVFAKVGLIVKKNRQLLTQVLKENSLIVLVILEAVLVNEMIVSHDQTVPGGQKRVDLATLV